MNDYYKILEIPISATKEEIKKSYRRLALKYHPDKNPDNLEYNKIFVKINKAYSILYNETSRKQYNLKYSIRSKHTQAVTPELFLEKIQGIRKFIFGKGRTKISHKALYKSLNNLLSDNNLRYLRTNKKEIINKEIVEEVLRCCSFLPTEDVKKIANKLLFLVGYDIKIQVHIKEYISKHKYMTYSYLIKDFAAIISNKIINFFR